MRLFANEKLFFELRKETKDKKNICLANFLIY